MAFTEHADRLVADFKFADFREAMAIMVEIAFVADKADHHPEWSNVYNKLHIELTTHDAGGITDKDRKLAAAIDKIVARRIGG
jgi:4a-hydroxytetrahydrobiopterin dehydratase